MKRAFFLLTLPLIFWAARGWALDAGGVYSVILSKVNSNGTTTEVDSVKATADSSGKISFTFSASVVPTVEAGTHFIVVTVKNGAGEIVRQSLSPAPCAGETTNVGVNGLSDVQSKALLEGTAAAGSDDSIYAGFGFMLLQSSKISAADRTKISACGRTAILGSGGMISYLQDSCGWSSATLNTFRDKIVCNSKSGTKDLGDYSAKFKDMVDNDDASAGREAGGFIGEIFIDAMDAASRSDYGCFLASFETAGGKTESDSNCTSISSASITIVDQAIRSFFQKIAAAKVRREYLAAFSALNASGSLVDRFTSAANTMLTCLGNIFDKYSDKFEDQSMSSSDQTAMNSEFTTCFDTFKTNSRLTDAEVSSLKSSLATALGIASDDARLNRIGNNRDFNGNSVNASIPEGIQLNFLASILTAGGSLTYTRDTLAIPSLMQWLTSRTTFNSGLASLDALEGLREDIEIIQFSFFSTFAGGGPVTRDQEKTAKATLESRLTALISNIGGTTNGSTAFTDDQEKGLIKTMLEPDFN